MGGAPFNKNSLHGLLTNRIYLGKVTYRGEIYEGEQDAIVDPEAFDLVQKRLHGNRINAGDRIHGRSAGVLAGLIHCTACNSAMTHTISSLRRENKRYRYYVCGKATKRGRKSCPQASLPAEEVERFVIAQLQSLTIDEDLLLETCSRVRRSVTKHQHRRDRQRLETVSDQLIVIESATPDRVAILRAVKDLESLWDHLTIGERSRLMTVLIERIEHDPIEGNLSITLSPTGLQSFGTSQFATTPSNPDRRS